MKNKLKTILKKPRIVILIIVLLLMLVVLQPHPFRDGAVINSVLRNSTAEHSGIIGPTPQTTPIQREYITAVNGVEVKKASDYFIEISKYTVNDTFTLKTSRDTYLITVEPLILRTELNETELVEVEEIEVQNVTINGTTTEQNVTVTKTVEKPIMKEEVLGPAPIGLRVDDAPKTNLRKGLDLQGGTRVILEPSEPISDDTLSLIVDSMKQRLNTFGLSDIVVTGVKDRPSVLGEGKKYVLVEIAGTTQEEVKDLLSKQGKFEAKIVNTTVFSGGNDITYVCRTPDCSGIASQGCGALQTGGYTCQFRFSISLSPQAAQRQADATAELSIVNDQTSGSQNQYLSENIILYLDDQEVDTLRIGADLKGRAVTEISISGSGAGATEQEALTDTLAQMKRLQTILISGSLPVKMNIVRSDTISPSLGDAFLKNALFIGLLALLAVTLVVTISYRSWKLALPIVITAVCEVFITMGIASLINWNIDLAAIAGIIVAVGTGVDDQIVIADEALKKSAGSQLFGWKQRIKRAFFVILAAYFTTLVAMLPLLFAGAGLLKGFAIITILGISVGVLITRPAFAAIVDVMLNEEDEFH